MQYFRAIFGVSREAMCYDFYNFVYGYQAISRTNSRGEVGTNPNYGCAEIIRIQCRYITISVLSPQVSHGNRMEPARLLCNLLCCPQCTLIYYSRNFETIVNWRKNIDANVNRRKNIDIIVNWSKTFILWLTGM